MVMKIYLLTVNEKIVKAFDTTQQAKDFAIKNQAPECNDFAIQEIDYDNGKDHDCSITCDHCYCESMYKAYQDHAQLLPDLAKYNPCDKNKSRLTKGAFISDLLTLNSRK